MAVERLCRNGRHPIEYRATHRDGRTYCLGCYEECNRDRAAAGLGRLGVWQTPVRDPEREQRYRTWAAALDDAIYAIRRDEGFDGLAVPWKTLETAS